MAVVLTQGEEVRMQRERENSITPDIPWRPTTYWLQAVLPACAHKHSDAGMKMTRECVETGPFGA